MKSHSVISFMFVLLHSVLSQPQGGRNFTVGLRGLTYRDVGVDLTHRRWVTFQVRTAGGAVVGLLQNHTFAYQIIVGRRFYWIVKTCIRVYAKHPYIFQHCEDTPGIVSVHQLRWFWISWQDDVVQFGGGYRPGLNLIVNSSNDRVPSINSMSIASINNIRGFWIIPEVYYVSGYRLVNSSLPTEGRLEALEYVDEVDGWYWIPHAADRFDDHDAGVACLTLGFGRSGMVVNHRYGHSTDFKIFVDCKGYESTLRECRQHIMYSNATRDVFISCNNRVLQPSLAIQDGSMLVYPNGVNNTYGNNVTVRSASVNVNYTFSSWINKISTVAAGIMKNFYLFVDVRNTNPSLKRLQLWRPVSGSDYMLIWERIANVSGVDNHTLYKFDVSTDNVEVSAGDCIGWTNEDNNTWISADHCSAQPCQCSASYDFGTTYDWPVVNRTSTFECRAYSFSVAVEIRPFVASTTETSQSNVQQLITVTIVVACVVVLVVITAAVLLPVLLCYKRKFCCFTKSSPMSGASATMNIYDLQPVADSSSTSSGQGTTTDSTVSTTPSAAATDGRIYYDNSVAASAGLAPTASGVYDVLFPGEGADVLYDTLRNAPSPQNGVPPRHQQAQCRDSGLTLVENTLYS